MPTTLYFSYLSPYFLKLNKLKPIFIKVYKIRCNFQICGKNDMKKFLMLP